MRGILLMLLYLVPSMLFAQNVEKDIQDIRKKFQAINKMKGLREVRVLVPGTSAYRRSGGGEELTLTGYFKGSQLQKMVVSAYFSAFKETTEYYYWDGKPVFIYQKIEQATTDTSTYSLDFTKLTTRYECRVYCKNNLVIRLLESGTMDHTTTLGQVQKTGQSVVMPVAFESRLKNQ